MTDRPLLSKSLFRSGRECVRRMWFDQHERYRKPLPSEAEKSRWADAAEVREWAQRRYPDAVFARFAGQNNDMVAAHTRELMDGDAPVIFEATFIAEGRIVRCDVIRRLPEGWAIESIKGSTFEEGKKKVKPDHVTDLAFQLALLRKAGVNAVATHLVLLDRTYLWDGGDHDIHHLFISVDVTADAERLQPEIELRVTHLADILAEPYVPEAELHTHCKKCDYHRHCLRDLPKDDLIYMSQVRKPQVDKWRAAGYQTIRDLPEAAVTDGRMIPTYRAIVTGQPWVCRGLPAALAEIQFPAAFIDFESCSTAIPAYPGTTPYEQICFQWSAHILTSPDAEPIHYEFLWEETSDPRPAFCETLWQAIREARTVVTYSIFERAQVRSLAQAGYPGAAEIAESVDRSTVDLEKLVADNIYLAEFNYRTSIKNVLPALVPHMSYDDLTIGDGSLAMTAFRRMIDSPEDEKRTISADLRAYCRQDTLAMVEIYRALKAVESAILRT